MMKGNAALKKPYDLMILWEFLECVGVVVEMEGEDMFNIRGFRGIEEATADYLGEPFAVLATEGEEEGGQEILGAHSGNAFIQAMREADGLDLVFATGRGLAGLASGSNGDLPFIGS